MAASAGDSDVPFKDYVDTQLAEVRRAAQLALEADNEPTATLRDYFEAILDEQRRGMIVAEQEREKAAKALRDELNRAIADGDGKLIDHITQQIAQVREAMISADKLELARIAAVADKLHELNRAGHVQVEARIAGVAREVQIIQASSEKAIEKAEAANEKRFESVNEFRNSLGDQTASFLPREVADAQFSEMRKAIQANADRITRITGNHEGEAGARAAVQPWALWAAGAVITIIIACIVIAANIATTP